MTHPTLNLTIDIVSAHSRIIEKIRKGNVAYAVFIVSGRARETAINSELFLEVSQTMPEKMFGIYDCSVNAEWLLQDLQNAESEVRHEYCKSL